MTLSEDECVLCHMPLINLNPPLGMCSNCQKFVEEQVQKKVANRKQKKKRIKMKIGVLKHK